MPEKMEIVYNEPKQEMRPEEGRDIVVQRGNQQKSPETPVIQT